MTSIIIKCPMSGVMGHDSLECGSKRHILFKGRKNGFDFYECSYCKLVFIDKLSLKDNLAIYYDPLYQEEKRREPDHFKDLSFLTPFLLNLSNSSEILDVGCGNGELVKKLRDRGYKAYGIDPIINNSDSPWLKHSNVFSHQPNKQFDLIIVYQVFEHIIKPRKALLRMLKWLKHEGVLYIHTDMEVERPDNILDWYYAKPPWHCCYYQHKTFNVFQKEIEDTSLNIVWTDPWSVAFKKI